MTHAAGLCAALVTAPLAHAQSTVFDANALTIASSSGDGVNTSTNSGAHNGDMRIYLSNAVSDYITYQVNVPSAGNYNLAVRYHKNPNRGTIQLAIGGVNQGGALDLYDPVGAFEEFALGTVSLPAGAVNFSFTVTGHNSSSSSYRIALDTITLTPASTTTRVDITTYPTMVDALNSGVPLYAPPGTYTLPASFTPTQDIDILGSVDPGQRPVFNVQSTTFLPSNHSLRFQGISFVGAAPGRKLFQIVGETFDMPSYVVLDCTFDSCNPIQWGKFPSITGQVIRRMEMRRFSIANAARGLYAMGRVDDYDITDFTVDNCGRFGVIVGPSGSGINPTITSYMQRGMVARGVITGTRIEGENSGQLILSGHNVVVEDMDLLNMVLPSKYHTDVTLANDYPKDAEPFYTKVEVLTVNNVYIENDGAKQAMWANKGADHYSDPAPSPNGRDATATNLTFVNTGDRYCVGIWHQATGDNLYKDVIFSNRTNDALIIHLNSSAGTITLQNWTEINLDPAVSAAFPGIKNKSHLNDYPRPPAPDPVVVYNSTHLVEYVP